MDNNEIQNSKDEYQYLRAKYSILEAELHILKSIRCMNVSEAKYAETVENVELFSKFCKEKVFEMSKNAHRYDISECIRANGFRSTIKMFDRLIIQITNCVEKLNRTDSSSTSHYFEKLQNFEKFLIAIYPIYCLSTTIMRLQPKDLFLDRDSIINKILYENATSFITEVFYGELFGYQFNPKVRKILLFIAAGLASYASGYEFSHHKILQTFVAFGKNGYFLMNTKNRSLKLKEIYSNPSIEFLKSAMSLMESYGLQYIPAILGPNLHINRVLYIRIKPINVPFADKPGALKLFSDGRLPGCNDIPPIKLRIMSMNLYEGQNETFSTALIPLFSPLPNADELLVYVHGGGFVGLSSKSCEMYLREWALQLKIPFVCIDYTLSPEAVYPQAVWECFYIYCWLLLNHVKMGSTAKKIILVGDSAGSNLIFAMTYLAVIHGIRIPDGLVACYPSCYTVDTTSPSRTLCFTDSFLSFGLLYTARYSYFNILPQNNISKRSRCKSVSTSLPTVGKLSFSYISKLIDMHQLSLPYYQGAETISALSFIDEQIFSYSSQEQLKSDGSDEPLASPLMTPKNVLEKYPPVRMILVELDPLLDDGVEFSKKLLDAGVNLNVDIIEDLPHGFLQLHSATSESQIACDIVLSRIKELLSHDSCS